MAAVVAVLARQIAETLLPRIAESGLRLTDTSAGGRSILAAPR
jgi:hypothetical protein